jgi:hypothetical protein
MNLRTRIIIHPHIHHTIDSGALIKSHSELLSE